MGYEAVSCGTSYTGGKEATLVVQGWLVEGQQDASVLQRAWWDLVHDWPLLAARLRVNEGRKAKLGREKWDFHVPDSKQVHQLQALDESKRADDKTRLFTILDRRPAGVRQHYRSRGAKDLAQDRPSMIRVQDRLHLWASNCANSLSQLLKEDRAMISVHICCFQDATMIAFALPHFVSHELKGERIALAWSGCIRGISSEKLVRDTDFQEFDTTLHSSLPPPAPPGWRVLSEDERSALGARYTWGNFWGKVWNVSQKKLERRSVFLPRAVCEEIRAQDVHEHRGEKESGAVDAVAAWLIKRCNQDKASDRQLLSVSLYHVLNDEWLPSDEEVEPDVDMFLRKKEVSANLPAMAARRVVSELSLGQLTDIIRQETARQTTAAAASKAVRWRLWARGKSILQFEPSSNAFILGLPDKQKSDLFRSINFSTNEFEARVLNLWGHTSFITTTSIITYCGITDNGPDGGLWVSGCLTRKQWEMGFGDWDVA